MSRTLEIHRKIFRSFSELHSNTADETPESARGMHLRILAGGEHPQHIREFLRIVALRRRRILERMLLD